MDGNRWKLGIPYLEKVAPYIPGRPIEEVMREQGLSHCVKLASNENCFGPSLKVTEAIRRELASLNRYPDGNSSNLVQALGSHFQIEERCIAVGNGACELIDLIIRACVGEGEEVLTSEKAFCIYSIATRAFGRKLVEVPMRGLHFDLEAMLHSLSDKTKLVFIANPNNPTGTYVTEKELLFFLEQTKNKKMLVVLDEAYFYSAKILTSHCSRPFPDGIALFHQYPHLVVLRSFSKEFGLAGIRLGFAVGVPEIIAYLHRIRGPFNVSSLAQIAGVVALSDFAHVENYLKLLEREIPKLYRGYEEIGFSYTETAANFILVDMGRPAAPFFKRLLKKGIITRTLEPYLLPNHLRITVGAPEENAVLLSTLQAEI